MNVNTDGWCLVALPCLSNFPYVCVSMRVCMQSIVKYNIIITII